MNREEAARRELAALKAKKTGVGRTILGLDPGTKSTGIAVVKDGCLAYVTVVRNVPGKLAKDRLPEMCQKVGEELESLLRGYSPDTIVLEWQEPRPDDPRPRDILHMAVVLGAALGIERPMSTKLLLPLPVQWKGSISGDIFTQRVRELPIGQRAVEVMTDLNVSPGEQHNGLDAVAMALWGINERMPWSM